MRTPKGEKTIETLSCEKTQGITTFFWLTRRKTQWGQNHPHCYVNLLYWRDQSQEMLVWTARNNFLPHFIIFLSISCLYQKKTEVFLCHHLWTPWVELCEHSSVIDYPCGNVCKDSSELVWVQQWTHQICCPLWTFSYVGRHNLF